MPRSFLITKKKSKKSAKKGCKRKKYMKDPCPVLPKQRVVGVPNNSTGGSYTGTTSTHPPPTLPLTRLQDGLQSPSYNNRCTYPHQLSENYTNDKNAPCPTYIESIAVQESAQTKRYLTGIENKIGTLDSSLPSMVLKSSFDSDPSRSENDVKDNHVSIVMQQNNTALLKAPAKITPRNYSIPHGNTILSKHDTKQYPDKASDDIHPTADDSGYRTSSLYSPVSSCDISDGNNDLKSDDGDVRNKRDAVARTDTLSTSFVQDNVDNIAPVADSVDSDTDDISVGDEADTSFTCESKYRVADEPSDHSLSMLYTDHLDKVVKDSTASKEGKPIVITPQAEHSLSTNKDICSLPSPDLSPKNTNSTTYEWNKGHIANILADKVPNQPPLPPKFGYTSHLGESNPYFWINNLPSLTRTIYPQISPIPYPIHPPIERLPSTNRYHPYHMAGPRYRPTAEGPLTYSSLDIKTGYEFQPHLNVPYKKMQSPQISPSEPSKHLHLVNTLFTSPSPLPDNVDLSPTSPRSASDQFKYLYSEGECPKYCCPDCKKSYSTYSGLTKHKQFHCVAQAKKEFSCKHCNKTYTSLGALKMHIRTHTLPCKCQICGKAFSRPWLLQGHIRTHTGEKPFTCQHCNRAFADRSNLRAHLQTHSEVKKYSCQHCTKTFSRMSLLMKHEDGGCSGV